MYDKSMHEINYYSHIYFPGEGGNALKNYQEFVSLMTKNKTHIFEM